MAMSECSGYAERKVVEKLLTGFNTRVRTKAENTQNLCHFP